jgi:hypothetical protein
MTKKRCRPCGEYTQHKPYRTGLYKYEGEKVLTCKKCGHLRTNSQNKIIESEMIYKPTQTKKKNMEDDNQ